MGHDTTLTDDNITEEFVQSAKIVSNLAQKNLGHLLFVVTDSQLQVTGHDTLFLVVASSITSEFQNFSCEIFEDGSKVNYRIRVASITGPVQQ